MMNCFFYDVTDVINITNTGECGFFERDTTITRGCSSSECDIRITRKCNSSECVKNTHSRIAPGSIRATTLHFIRGGVCCEHG